MITRVETPSRFQFVGTVMRNGRKVKAATELLEAWLAKFESTEQLVASARTLTQGAGERLAMSHLFVGQHRRGVTYEPLGIEHSLVSVISVAYGSKVSPGQIAIGWPSKPGGSIVFYVIGHFDDDLVDLIVSVLESHLLPTQHT